MPASGAGANHSEGLAELTLRALHLCLSLEFSGPVGSGFLTILGPTGPQPVAKKVKFLATATATAHN
jgi:hypothetical protein